MSDEQRSGDLAQIARRVGLWVGTFLGGALAAFAYSYLPLHSAKDWKIGYLEERLAAKDALLQNANEELAAVRGEAADKPDSETFKLLQQELVTTDKTIKELEQKLARAERRAQDAERARNDWKRRHGEAEQARQAMEADTAAPELDEDPEPYPASPGDALPSAVP